MTYGYRIFYFEIHEQFTRAALPLDTDINGQPAISLVDALLNQLAADKTKTREAMPRIQNAADGSDADDVEPTERGDAAIQWLSTSKVGSMHLTTHVYYGRVQGHPTAIGSGGPNRPIDGFAPAHPHRVEFLFPKGGDQGIIVAEDIDRSCPGGSVAQWVSRLSKNQADHGVWYRVMTTPLSDDERLEQLIKDSKQVEIRLKRQGKSGSGKHLENPLTITAEVASSDDRATLATEARKWLKKDSKARTESLGILSEVAGVTSLEPDEADLYVRDAQTGKRIKPTQVSDVFIYPISDSRPSQDQWETAVKGKLSALGGSLGFDLQW